MKLVVVSAVAAVALALGACSHMSDSAGLGAAPVASLTPDQMRAQLAAISQQLRDISQVSVEERSRARAQVRALAFNEGRIGRAALAPVGAGTLEGSTEDQAMRSAARRTKVEVLHERQNELRAQLAVRERQG